MEKGIISDEDFEGMAETIRREYNKKGRKDEALETMGNIIDDYQSKISQNRQEIQNRNVFFVSRVVLVIGAASVFQITAALFRPELEGLNIQIRIMSSLAAVLLFSSAIFYLFIELRREIKRTERKIDKKYLRISKLRGIISGEKMRRAENGKKNKN